jgi:hypothetical protein
MRGPKQGRPGDELTWSWLNSLVSWCQRNTINLGACSGLSAVPTPQGIALAVSGLMGAQVAYTKTAITASTAGVSGGAPGQGTAYFANFDGTNLNLDNAATTNAVTVYNLQDESVDAGTYIWIQQDPAGFWWVTDFGATGEAFFCQPSSAVSGATGSFPSLTPTSFTATVYQMQTGTLTSFETGATVWNGFPAALVASKVCFVTPDGAGDWVVISQSCT